MGVYKLSYHFPFLHGYKEINSVNTGLPNSHEAGNEYRYGFQGQELDNEIKGEGNSVNYKYRMHDPRVGRFFAVNPLAAKYPFYTPYSFSGNELIHMVELEGLEPEKPGSFVGETQQASAYNVPDKIWNWTWTETGQGQYHWIQGNRYTGANAKESYALSEHVYTIDEPGIDPGSPESVVGNWKLIDEYILGGFKAGTYERTIDGVTFYTTAFAGTDDFLDVITDLNQGIGNFDYQYALANLYSSVVIAKYGNNITFTGHSLGGGLASLAALTKNKSAITFNAAGLSNGTKSLYNISESKIKTSNITAFIVKGEILNSTLSVFGQGAIGNIYYLSSPLGGIPSILQFTNGIEGENWVDEYEDAYWDWKTAVLSWQLNNHKMKNIIIK